MVGGVRCLGKTFPMEFAEMAKLWEFASNAPKFELKDIEAALDEIQVDFFIYALPPLYLSPSDLN